MLRISTLASALVIGAAASACVTEDNYPQRAAEVACQKMEECSPDALTADCQQTYEAQLEATLAECDKYRGDLAHRCLAAVEKQSCDESEVPGACEDFNEKCGFDVPRRLEDSNLESYGFGQLRVAIE